MNKWIAEFELEDGDTMPEHMDLEYKGARIDFHCKPLEQESTTKNDLEVDCISRKVMRDLGATCIAYRNDKQELIPIISIDELPTVTPQEPRCKNCKWWKDSDGEYRRGCGAESQCPINRREVFEGNGYCFLFEPQESEGT